MWGVEKTISGWKDELGRAHQRITDLFARSEVRERSMVCELGWAKEQVIVVDEDPGLSGSGSVKRSGFARMTAEVALGHVGIMLGLEVSRLACNNANCYRLLDLCGMTDTLIG